MDLPPVNLSRDIEQRLTQGEGLEILEGVVEALRLAYSGLEYAASALGEAEYFYEQDEAKQTLSKIEALVDFS